MINVEKALPELEQIRQQSLETEIIELIAEYLDVDASKATKLYYSSNLSKQIASNTCGLRSLDAHYLFADLLENEPELFSKL